MRETTITVWCDRCAATSERTPGETIPVPGNPNIVVELCTACAEPLHAAAELVAAYGQHREPVQPKRRRPTLTAAACERCGKQCASRQGLAAHNRTQHAGEPMS